ncbi:unnamed protein product [Candida verbasci]|uniref:Uncharacterized protein n=1 Tax=Candida verbasci TaxID=1227364 RepID=A0A9W4TW26_9ASCO|nr:unnamed protein product [Candida verbasci]
MIKRLVLLRPIIFNIHRRKRLFQTTTCINTNVKSTINFISNTISNQFDFNDSTTQTLISQVPNLKSNLNKAVDYENKLYTLLLYDPILIDPKLYLFFYYHDVNRNETIKKLLIKRLVYHRQFKACWQIFMESYTSISDLDTFIETVDGVLHSKFDFLDFILCMPLEDNHQFKQLVNTITYIYKPDFEIEEIIELWSQYSISPPLKDDTIEYKIIYLKKMIDKDPEDVFYYISKYPEVLNYPGWTSLLPNQSTCKYSPRPKFEMTDTIKVLDETDTLNVLDSVDPSKILQLTTSQNSILINMIARRILKNPNPEAIDILFNYSLLLNEKSLNLLCSLAIEYNLDLIKLPQKCLDKFESSLEPQQYIQIIKSTNKNHKLCRKFIHSYAYIANSKDFQQLILSAGSELNKITILEIFRAAILKSKIFDQLVIIPIFNILITKSIKGSTGYQLNRSLNFVLDCFCQSISLADSKDIAKILDILSDYIQSEKFNYDVNFKRHILERIINRVIEFVIFTTRKEDALIVIQGVKDNLRANKWYFRKWIIMKLIIDDHKNAMRLIKFYQEDKFILSKYHSYFISGILQNRKLKLREKFELIDRLKKKYEELKLENKLKDKHYLTIATQLYIFKKNKELDMDSIRWFCKEFKDSKKFREVIKRRVRQKNDLYNLM